MRLSRVANVYCSQFWCLLSRIQTPSLHIRHHSFVFLALCPVPSLLPQTGSVLFVVSAACDLLNQAAEGDAIIGAAMGGGISNCSSRQGGNQWTVPRQEQQDQPKQSSNSLELQRDDEERRHAGASDSARPASIRDPQDLLQSTKVMRQPEEEQGDKEPSCCCRCCRVSDPLLMCIVNLLGAAAYLAGSVFYLPTLYASDPSRGPWLFAVGSVLYMAPPALSRLIPRASDDAAFAPAVLSSSIIADSMVFAGAAAFLAACAMDLTGVATGNISGGVAWPLWLFVLGCVAFLVAACANFGLFVPSAWCSTAAAAEAPLCCGGSGSDARAASPSPRRL